MSFSEKVAALMARPGQDPTPKEDVPWWMKYAGRGLGTVGSFITIFLGLFNCTGIVFADTACLIGGILQMLVGFFVACCEAPCCCMFLDHVQRLSDWVDRRPYWNKAAAYVVFAIIPLTFCHNLSSIFGNGLILGTGVIYGMMAIGRKASAEEMRQAAAAESGLQNSTNVKPNSMRDNLVANAQPVSFTSAPIFDSNV